jgi:hypothetical protein
LWSSIRGKGGPARCPKSLKQWIISCSMRSEGDRSWLYLGEMPKCKYKELADNTFTVSLRRASRGFSYFESNVHTKFLIEILSGQK